MHNVRHLLKVKGSDIWTIPPDASAYEALQLMAEKNIGALPVTENEQLVGIFSERDYARKVVLRGRTSRETTVKELMTTEVLYVGPDEHIHAVLKLMTSKRVRHLPVLEHGKLIGIVTIGDVGKAIIDEQADTIRVLETYIVGKESKG
jgi:CBS domain-containing protein